MAFLDELYDYFARDVNPIKQSMSFSVERWVLVVPPNPYCSTNLESCMSPRIQPINHEAMWAAEPAADLPGGCRMQPKDPLRCRRGLRLGLAIGFALHMQLRLNQNLGCGTYGAGSRQAPIHCWRISVPVPSVYGNLWFQKLFFCTRNCFTPASISHEYKIDLD
ncbi:hypothetical protein FB451DRAFT_1182693 [Mycena latifolia]|nr:hypothetical protein FB451DRAFT_1182693 [Mycena latifolia]